MMFNGVCKTLLSAFGTSHLTFHGWLLCEVFPLLVCAQFVMMIKGTLGGHLMALFMRNGCQDNIKSMSKTPDQLHLEKDTITIYPNQIHCWIQFLGYFKNGSHWGAFWCFENTSKDAGNAGLVLIRRNCKVIRRNKTFFLNRSRKSSFSPLNL